MRVVGGFLVACLITLLALSPGWAAPALWRVTDDDSEVWLFGSIHFLDTGRKWRTPQFDEALAGAEHVYFEIVLEEASYATFERLATLYGGNRDGRRLSDHLTERQQKTLYSYLDRNDLDADQFEQVRPWMAEMMLMNLPTGTDETDPRWAAGVETLLVAEIEPERTRGLETPELQFRLFVSAPEAEQVASLMRTIDSLESDGGTLSDLVGFWLTGDLGALHLHDGLTWTCRGTPLPPDDHRP